MTLIGGDGKQTHHGAAEARRTAVGGTLGGWSKLPRLLRTSTRI